MILRWLLHKKLKQGLFLRIYMLNFFNTFLFINTYKGLFYKFLMANPELEPEPVTRFEYDLMRADNGMYLATMFESITGSDKPMPYKIGDDVPLTDEFINGNNSSRLRSCLVRAVIPHEILPYSFVLHLEPTKKEFKPFGRLNWQKISRLFVRGVDWSGSDGWLDFNRKP
jgi:hypothetical protein